MTIKSLPCSKKPFNVTGCCCSAAGWAWRIKTCEVWFLMSSGTSRSGTHTHMLVQPASKWAVAQPNVHYMTHCQCESVYGLTWLPIIRGNRAWVKNSVTHGGKCCCVLVCEMYSANSALHQSKNMTVNYKYIFPPMWFNWDLNKHDVWLFQW